MLKGKETDGDFTFECRFFFKAYRIVKGHLDSSPISTFLTSVSLIFGSDGGSWEKSFSKLLNKSIALLNFLSTFLDNLSPASAADFNASSAVIKTLFVSQRNGVKHR